MHGFPTKKLAGWSFIHLLAKILIYLWEQTSNDLQGVFTVILLKDSSEDFHQQWKYFLHRNDSCCMVVQVIRRYPLEQAKSRSSRLKKCPV